MQRFLRDAAADLTFVAVDRTGARQEAEGCTVTITDSAGIELAGSPFVASAGEDDAWELALPASLMATLDVYTTVAEFDMLPSSEKRRSQFEVVGGFLFEIEELRNYDDELADEEDPSNALLCEARDAAMDRFEHRCRPCFWRRGRRARLNGVGTDLLVLPDLYPQSIIAMTVDGTALDVDELGDLGVYQWGGLQRPDTIWPRGLANNVEGFYEHGLDDAPRVARNAGIKLAASYLIKSPVPDRATVESTDAGNWRVSVAGRDGPTGIPEVDAILDEFSGGDIVVG